MRHRVKTEGSVQRKVSRKDASYGGLEDVHDLLGLRIITFFPDEVDQVAEVVESEFEIDLENSVDKRALLDPDRFGYLSRHYVAALNDDRRQLTEHTRFEGLCFEIQIRSILQHAWAEIEHDLGYHSAGAIPDSVRRRFSRLAGLLEIADDEFQTLRHEVADYQSAIDQDVDETPESVPIDQDSITALVNSSSVIQDLDRYIANALETKLVEETPTAGVAAARFQWTGIETIAQVVEAIHDREALIRAFAVRWSGRSERVRTEVYLGISLFYLTYVLVAESGDLQQVLAYLNGRSIGPAINGTREELAQEVLDTYAIALEDSAK